MLLTLLAGLATCYRIHVLPVSASRDKFNHDLWYTIQSWELRGPSLVPMPICIGALLLGPLLILMYTFRFVCAPVCGNGFVAIGAIND